VNVLFLCHRLPYPPNKGDKIRSYHLLQHLLERHTVYLGCFIDDPNDFDYLEHVKSLVEGRCKILPLPRYVQRMRMVSALANGRPLSTASFYDKSLQEWINQLITDGGVDRAVLFGSAMAPYLLGPCRLAKNRVVLDMVDIDSDKWRQYAHNSSGPLKFVYARESRTLFDLEREAVDSFGASLFVSDFETRTWQKLCPNGSERVFTSRNGVDIEYFSPDRTFLTPYHKGELPIVMTGRMDYRPNTQGAAWFASKVLPIVRKTVPSARFYIVGAEPPASLKALANSDVVVTGSVDDIRPYIAHASVAVAPLHMARGVQNKVLEAMAMGKIVVATTPATRALDVTPGRELYVANEPQEFAAAVITAMRTDGSFLGNSAKVHIADNYNWKKNLAIIDQLLDRPASLARNCIPAMSSPIFQAPENAGRA
jgi:sugar transferase (PEP-CTERM/EpsH1 system associated)